MSFYNTNFESLNKVKETVSHGNFEKNDVHYYKYVDGDNTFFFLPPYNEKGDMFKSIHRIFNLPNGSGGMTAITCLELTYPELGIPCPVLQVIREAQSKGIDVTRYKPNQSFSCNVIDYKGKLKKLEDGKEVDFSITPQILTLTKRVLQDILKLTNVEETNNFWDPYNAMPIKIVKTSGGRVDYKVIPFLVADRDRKERSQRFPINEDKSKIETIADLIPDLDLVFKANPDEVIAPDGRVFKIAQELRNILIDKFKTTGTTVNVGDIARNTVAQTGQQVYNAPYMTDQQYQQQQYAQQQQQQYNQSAQQFQQPQQQQQNQQQYQQQQPMQPAPFQQPGGFQQPPQQFQQPTNQQQPVQNAYQQQGMQKKNIVIPNGAPQCYGNYEPFETKCHTCVYSATCSSEM